MIGNNKHWPPSNNMATPRLHSYYTYVLAGMLLVMPVLTSCGVMILAQFGGMVTIRQSGMRTLPCVDSDRIVLVTENLHSLKRIFSWICLFVCLVGWLVDWLVS